MLGSQILIVEDDDAIREALSMVLLARHYTVSEAADGASALELLHSAPVPPRLIILDLMMPRMNGEEFVAALRQIPHLASIPVVVLSGQRGAEEKARAIGATRCLKKPVDIDELFRTVQEFVTHNESVQMP